MLAITEPHLPGLATELAVKSLVLLAVILSLTWFMRRSSAAERHMYLAVAAVALMLLPAAVLILPSWNVDLIPIPGRNIPAGPEVGRPGGAGESMGAAPPNTAQAEVGTGALAEPGHGQPQDAPRGDPASRAGAHPEK